MKAKTLLLASALILLAGCSHNVTSKTEPTACSIMPKELAESVLGVKLEDPESMAFGEIPRLESISNCLYRAEKNDQLKSLTFTIRKNTIVANASTPADAYIVTKKHQFGSNYNIQKLDGVGDGAVWDPALKQLTVFKNSNTYVWVSPGSKVGDLQSKFVDLAKRTVAKS